MSAPHWDKEKAFCKELDKAIERATESRLLRVAEIAVDDARLFYKLVVKLFERAGRQPSSKAKVNTLFAISEVLRLSRQRLGASDKYGETIRRWPV